MRLVGVGMGPGDPGLVTVAALSALRSADRVFAPSVAPDVVGRAESVARQACPDVRVERLVVQMSGANCYAGAARVILTGLRTPTAGPGLQGQTSGSGDHSDGGGRSVAVLTLGDPNLYSTFFSLAAAVTDLDPTISVRTVPGITAFQALASRAGMSLGDGRERLHLVTALDGVDDLDRALADPQATIVVYKGGKHLPQVAQRLAASGRLDAAVMGELMGLAGEQVRPLAEVADQPASYLATVIVPAMASRPAGTSRTISSMAGVGAGTSAKTGTEAGPAASCEVAGAAGPSASCEVGATVTAISSAPSGPGAHGQGERK
ncbi:MAG: precorrin-2 C(20)-methyltransferase [Acidimicrobiales bacterium]